MSQERLQESGNLGQALSDIGDYMEAYASPTATGVGMLRLYAEDNANNYKRILKMISENDLREFFTVFIALYSIARNHGIGICIVEIL